MDGAVGGLQRTGKTLRAFTVVLQQMQRHALRRLGAYSRQAAKRLRQFIETAERLHPLGQKGNLKPGGSGNPAVIPANFS